MAEEGMDPVRSLDDFPDGSFFEETVTLPALDIPVTQTARLRKALSHVLWRRPKLSNVRPHATDPQRRLLLLKDEEALQDGAVVRELRQNQQQESANNGDDSQDKDPEGCRATTYRLVLTYEDLSVEQALRKLLPREVHEVPSAYESVGTIAHVNLPADCLPFQYWIGKVLLDKNQPQVRTVVNKLSSIDQGGNPFRTFAMQVIAGFDGEGWSQVTVREEGCVYQLDFTQVYWNSRLAGEHKRLVRLLREDALARQQEHGAAAETVVVDLMAGVGPFAIPLTKPPPSSKGHKKKKQKKGREQPSAPLQPKITIYANDLNPASFRYLQQNAVTNKCQDLHCSNLDARALVHQLQQENGTLKVVHHYVLNLPASAPEFLDAFRGYQVPTAGDDDQQDWKLPMIYVYCFAPKQIKKQDQQDDKSGKDNESMDSMIHNAVFARCERALGCPLDRPSAKIHIVRDVAPNKNMLCVSFRLPPAVQQVPPVVIKTSSAPSVATVDKAEADAAKEEEILKPSKRLKKDDDSLEQS